MTPYWLMFLLPSIGSLFGLGQHRGGKRRDQAFLVMLFVIFAMLIGLRDATGGDFFNYKKTIDALVYLTWETAMKGSDPGFTIIAEASNWFGFGIYGVNFVCGLLLLYGLLRFVRTLPDPWLAMAAAVPYMIIVIGMGYIRQGVAIGFILLAMMHLERRHYVWMGIHLIVSLLFHITALCVLPLIGLSILRRQPLALVAIAVIGILAYYLILQARFNGLYSGYVLQKYDSSGALVRLLMNAVPATLFLVLRKRFPIAEPAKTAWVMFALMALVLVPMLSLLPGSTVIDRIGLYFSPIQLVMFGYLGTLFGADPRERRLIAFATILFYGIVLYVWLSYATNAASWIPYRWLLSPDPLP